MAMESQAPVAAIVDMILGISLLILIKRSEGRIWNERLAANLIAWLMIFSSGVYMIEALIEIFQDPGYWDGGPKEGNQVWFNVALYSMFAFNAMTMAITLVLPLIYPFPLIQEKTKVRLVLLLMYLIGVVAAFFIIMIGLGYSSHLNVFSHTAFVIWVMVYIKYNRSEIETGDSRHRAMAVASLLLLIGYFGSNTTWWASELLLLNNDFVTRYTIGMETDTSIIRFLNLSYLLLLGAMVTVILAFGEFRRAKARGISGTTWIIGTITLMGAIFVIFDLMVIDTTQSCVTRACEEFPAWYLTIFDIGSQTLHYLFRPLLFMYVVLNFNLVDVKAEQNQFIIKIMVVMLLLIVSSSITEMIQSIIPISQMVSAALMAAAIAAFLGWEEKLMNKIVKEGHSNSETLAEDGQLMEVEFTEKEWKYLDIGFYASLGCCILIAAFFGLGGGM